MPLSEREVEEVTGFVRRYCAVDGKSEEGEEPETEVRTGYFAFRQGKAQRTAKTARAPVVWGAFDRVLPEVLRRLRELCGNGEGHVFIAAYETGAKHPEEQVRVVGQVDALQEEDEEPVHVDQGSAVAAAVSGVLTMSRLIASENRELRDRMLRELDQRLEDRGQQTALSYYVAQLEQGQDDARMEAAVNMLGPILAGVAPQVVAMLGRALGGAAGAGGEAPAQPGARIVHLVNVMVATATDLGATIQGSPLEATRERIGPLYELIRQLMGPLGLTVTGLPDPPAAE